MVNDITDSFLESLGLKYTDEFNLQNFFHKDSNDKLFVTKSDDIVKYFIWKMDARFNCPDIIVARFENTKGRFFKIRRIAGAANGFLHTIFEGVIENQTEFKTLMKQLQLDELIEKYGK